MNPIVKFFHELLNPHCQHCIDVERERRNNSREDNSIVRDTLERQNALLRLDNERLMEALLSKDTTVEKIVDTSDLKPILTGRPSWATKRNELETASRIKHENNLREQQLMRDAPKPTKINVKEELEELKSLEQELDNARQEREGQTKVS